MSKKFFCFADIGVSSIKVACVQYNIKEKQYEILHIVKQNIPLDHIRYATIFQKSLILKTFIKMITNVEKELGFIINEVILILNEDAVNCETIKIEFTFNKLTKVNAGHLDSIFERAIEYYRINNPKEATSILDIIGFRYYLDNHKIIDNPEKLSTQYLASDIGIFSIKHNFTDTLNKHLEHFKIRAHHLISSCLGLYYVCQHQLKTDYNSLLIDFGSTKTSYCVVKNGVIRYVNTIKLGSFDITRDINYIFQINNIQAAENLKISMSDLVNKIANIPLEIDIGEKKRFIAIDNLNKAVNARVSEIFKMIHSNIIRFDNKIVINDIIISGGGANLSNIEQVILNVFTAAKITKINYDNGRLVSSFNKIKNFSDNEKQLFVPIIGAIDFFFANFERYSNLEKGFISQATSKITCLLRDILY